MKSIEAIYLLFAVAHPISEIIERTSLRRFLNEDYYESPHEDFPVTKRSGVGGSLFVMAVLILPLLFSLMNINRNFVIGCWWFALGLVLADLFQHGFHLISRPRKAAPRVHLITIVGTLVFLLWVAAESVRDMLTTGRLSLLLLGASIIFVNWFLNSWNAKHPGSAMLPPSPSAP